MESRTQQFIRAAVAKRYRFNELVEIVAGHIDDGGMTPDALPEAAQKILDDWEAK